jgi:hypothetical protein
LEDAEDDEGVRYLMKRNVNTFGGRNVNGVQLGLCWMASIVIKRLNARVIPPEVIWSTYSNDLSCSGFDVITSLVSL